MTLQIPKIVRKIIALVESEAQRGSVSPVMPL